jgi:glucose-1-phosphate cytidylyltransferase
MTLYAGHGLTDFVVCLGYKGYVIKEYFANYFLHTSDVTFDLGKGEMTVHRSATEPWRVTLVDTGAETQTGGRLKRAIPYAEGETFCMTYGDGLSDVDLRAVIETHQASGGLATVTAVQPPGRFGALDLDGSAVSSFQEKPRGDNAWINGGFFVLEPGVGDYIAADDTKWEEEPLRRLAADGRLAAYRHEGFWQGMDTLRDRNDLEALWASARAPWLP